MGSEEPSIWMEEFKEFHERYSYIFRRSETRDQSKKYIESLLANVPRKNGWQIAEAIGDETPDSTQRLLYRSKWDADSMRDETMDFIVEKFADEDGVGIVDETGFIKKGDKSAGVQRQYSGTAGKIENCQVGVFLGYASPKGDTLLDRRLYMPESWFEESERMIEAKIPADIKFRTKPELAMDMLEHAWSEGVPMRHVVGDEVYGSSAEFRKFVDRNGKQYALAVRSCITVWTRRANKPRNVKDVASGLKKNQWKSISVANGEKGPIRYEWAFIRVHCSENMRRGDAIWLIIRRSPHDSQDMAYYFSNAPVNTPPEDLARIISSRYKIEQCFKETKGETGLDEYEVRHWHSWYRHITLSMTAHVFLTAIRANAKLKKKRKRPGGIDNS